jgi:hypothetical protein
MLSIDRSKGPRFQVNAEKNSVISHEVSFVLITNDQPQWRGGSAANTASLEGNC